MNRLLLITFLLLTVARADEQHKHIRFDVVPDVTIYGDTGPVIEGYHLVIQLKDIELFTETQKVILKQKNFHWKFHSYEESTEVRKGLVKLKSLLGPEHSEEIDKISDIVRELTAGVKPDSVE